MSDLPTLERSVLLSNDMMFPSSRFKDFDELNWANLSTLSKWWALLRWKPSHWMTEHFGDTVSDCKKKNAMLYRFTISNVRLLLNIFTARNDRQYAWLASCLLECNRLSVSLSICRDMLAMQLVCIIRNLIIYRISRASCIVRYRFLLGIDLGSSRVSTRAPP